MPVLFLWCACVVCRVSHFFLAEETPGGVIFVDAQMSRRMGSRTVQEFNDNIQVLGLVARLVGWLVDYVYWSVGWLVDSVHWSVGWLIMSIGWLICSVVWLVDCFVSWLAVVFVDTW